MAYNRYRGGYGRPERVETPGNAPPRPVSPLPPQRNGPARPAAPVFQALKGLDTEDWLVMAVLYLAYRSSGDWEMLAALGAYFFGI